MTGPIYQIDAFTDQSFSGNPAAVHILADSKPDTYLQAVAAEMNLSETAFILPRDDGSYSLRWFTPVAEVELCGHATLASAHILWQTGRHCISSDIIFHTQKRGTLVCSRTENNCITMRFPLDKPKPLNPADIQNYDQLLTHLSLQSADVVDLFQGPYDLILTLESESLVRNLQPDFNALAAIPYRGIAVTAKADTKTTVDNESTSVDFISRFFAPSLRINEDPVTGSLHCVLAPYWSEKLGKSEFIAVQASPRSGTLYLELLQDKPGVLLISGYATTIFAGQLLT
ncbi:PhzF family phenazine biosynthesis protein [Poriferisphaera sp. WC338]|uniref:PhzF family phenazine biosynthesis protein n=1 Tax=Poriferisphaera sp. WC338 TaxID=3425129 RepID=UPI003D8143FF